MASGGPARFDDATESRRDDDADGDGSVLGVLGTFVLDRIVGPSGREEPVEDLGGLAYAVSAVAAALPDGWRARPVARVGGDAWERVRSWLHDLDMDTWALVDVPEPNNRVELRYHDDARRTERLTGGVGGWRVEALIPRIDGCDALLINFISGHELDLKGLRRLRAHFAGPIYADLHSLFLDTAEDGTREPRRLPDWRRWMACLDAVQVNDDELDLLGGSAGVEATVMEALAQGPMLFACTRGEDGVVCWWSPEVGSRFAGDRQPALPRDGSVVRREIGAVPVVDPDPTGCGDVWGAVMCCGLLAGEPVMAAAETATRLAGVAARRRGVTGLAGILSETLEAQVRDTATSDGGEEL